MLPDIEKGVQAVYEFAGSDFLLFKHGGTHSILGAVLLAGTAALLMAEDRQRGFWLFLMGTLSHLPLDAVSSRSGVAPFLPWSPWRVAGLSFLDAPLRILALAGLAVLLHRFWRAFRGYVEPDLNSDLG
jgi:membrane-bound metal-dependent hydrolase YbcI (DUF457 family)